MRTDAQNRQMHMLMNQLSIDQDTKRDLVSQVSRGRTESSRELSVAEAAALIEHLQRMVGRAQQFAQERDYQTDPCNKMRRKILSICHELGWETQDGKIDFDKLNNFLAKRGHPKKDRLNDYTLQELPMLVTQFETILKRSYEAKD